MAPVFGFEANPKSEGFDDDDTAEKASDLFGLTNAVAFASFSIRLFESSASGRFLS